MSSASGKLYRWDVYMGPPVDIGSQPPACYIKDFPPLPAETSREYYRRVTPEVLAEFDEVQERPERKWWQFWK